MQTEETPLIPAQQNIPEITWKVLFLSVILALILAASNAYLALKIGILTSASIPAAVLSMGILRFFKDSNILQNNLVQTAASAGEAVAGGIVYTVPALIIIHYWRHFPYWECFLIALIGGVLGVLFSVPLRRLLMNKPELRYPEGRAVAALLKVGHAREFGLKEMLYGGGLGALLEFMQVGLKVVANRIPLWFKAGHTLIGVSLGCSATLIGAGYIIGFRLGLSIFIGALIGWGFCVPLLGFLQHVDLTHVAVQDAAMKLWSEKVMYIGIGAMLVAGVWTLLGLLKPIYHSLRVTLMGFLTGEQRVPVHPIRTERDLPIFYVFSGGILMSLMLYAFFQKTFDIMTLGLADFSTLFVFLCACYVVLFGFIFSAICGYFSGLVGVSATPGSSIIIAGIFIAALILRTAISLYGNGMSEKILIDAAAVTIYLGAVVTGMACIANDNIQDLKVGHIVGATPWKQQLMLMLGVVVASLIIPLVMELLFNVYGIADVFPHEGMNQSEVLAAPPAALMAAITRGVFNHELPWHMVGIGVALAIVTIMVNQAWSRRGKGLSVLSLAMGIYLPLTSTTAIFVGGAIAGIVQAKLKRRVQDKTIANVDAEDGRSRGLLFACGLLSGAALMDVCLAIPFAFFRNPDVLQMLPDSWEWISMILGIASIWFLMRCFVRMTLPVRK